MWEATSKALLHPDGRGIEQYPICRYVVPFIVVPVVFMTVEKQFPIITVHFFPPVPREVKLRVAALLCFMPPNVSEIICVYSAG